MKKLIRIEHTGDGKGLFRSRGDGKDEYDLALINKSIFYDEIREKHKDFPIPQMDGTLDSVFDDNYFCAFKSIEQIQQWIEPEWWSNLFDLGFKVFLLEVIHCIEGEYQNIYLKTDVILKEDISSLFISQNI